MEKLSNTGEPSHERLATKILKNKDTYAPWEARLSIIHPVDAMTPRNQCVFRHSIKVILQKCLSAAETRRVFL